MLQFNDSNVHNLENYGYQPRLSNQSNFYMDPRFLQTTDPLVTNTIVPPSSCSTTLIDSVNAVQSLQSPTSYCYPFYHPNISSNNHFSYTNPSTSPLQPSPNSVCHTASKPASNLASENVSSHQTSAISPLSNPCVNELSPCVSSDNSPKSTVTDQTCTRKRKVATLKQSVSAEVGLEESSHELPSSSPATSSTGAKSMAKDERYVQRRMRNNLAAKRSRDNRKRREDTIALRAGYLERANMLLQAQVFALKKEICMLRGIPFDPNYPVTVTDPNSVTSSTDSLGSYLNADALNQNMLFTAKDYAAYLSRYNLVDFFNSDAFSNQQQQQQQQLPLR